MATEEQGRALLSLLPGQGAVDLLRLPLVPAQAWLARAPGCGEARGSGGRDAGPRDGTNNEEVGMRPGRARLANLS